MLAAKPNLNTCKDNTNTCDTYLSFTNVNFPFIVKILKFISIRALRFFKLEYLEYLFKPRYLYYNLSETSKNFLW
jgi:hypothetical protein